MNKNITTEFLIFPVSFLIVGQKWVLNLFRPRICVFLYFLIFSLGSQKGPNRDTSPCCDMCLVLQPSFLPEGKVETPNGVAEKEGQEQDGVDGDGMEIF